VTPVVGRDTSITVRLAVVVTFAEVFLPYIIHVSTVKFQGLFFGEEQPRFPCIRPAEKILKKGPPEFVVNGNHSRAFGLVPLSVVWDIHCVRTVG
jgi:hypothetical protein